MNTRILTMNGRSCRQLSRLSCLVSVALVGMLVSGCSQTMHNSAAHPPPLHSTASPSSHAPPTAGDTRIPLPLLPFMADHQKANMRDHLAAVQEILSALSTNNFPAVERAVARIGYSEQMGRMCEHMGIGAAGFTEMALNFHRTADTIRAAAKQHAADATLKAVSATLQTCVGCHATYRQQIVDEAAWKEISNRPRPTPAASSKTKPE